MPDDPHQHPELAGILASDYQQSEARLARLAAQERELAILGSMRRRLLGALHAVANYTSRDTKDEVAFDPRWTRYWLHAARCIRKYGQVETVRAISIREGLGYAVGREAMELALRTNSEGDVTSFLTEQSLRLQANEPLTYAPRSDTRWGLRFYLSSLEDHFRSKFASSPSAGDVEERSLTPLGTPVVDAEVTGRHAVSPSGDDCVGADSITIVESEAPSGPTVTIRRTAGGKVVDEVRVAGPSLVRLLLIVYQAKNTELSWKEILRRWMERDWDGKVLSEATLRDYGRRIDRLMKDKGFSKYWRYSVESVLWRE